MNARRLTWLGQASVLLDVGGLRIAIDPYFGEHPARLYPPGDAAPVASSVDAILVTHEHLDHFDPTFIRQAAVSRHVTLLVPTPLLDRASALGADVTGVQPGDRVTLAPGVEVAVLPAWHGLTLADGYAEGRDAQGHARFLGYVVVADGLTIYHAGDTIVTPELVAAASQEHSDVALLPTNGRDAQREAAGIVGNMDGREAVEFAAIIGARTLIPLHWDLFAGNTSDPQDVVTVAEAHGAGAPAVVVPVRDASFEL
ncbi:unannotated protein [freshwater metagenome]|uniref:Unannotated protein n=1 Tax=freshwater metagenome TaxID=449393 RepID=A0A6J6P6U7_9ZZZZ